jgi:hypothetical protein
MGDLEMSLYRRFARSKKGMSTIFGGLFFVILILMGFNVMLWGFVQLDAYNSTISRMSQRDQQATSENLVPVNSTCNSGCASGSGILSVIVNNLGGYSVNIPSVYIFNTNTTGSCEPTPCILTPISNTGNIPAGAVNFIIRVAPSVQILSSNSYHISLATSRGRLFNLFYPWRFSGNVIINNNGNGGNFVTNVGPLAIYFDSKSFNYTQGSSGPCSGVAPYSSCSAFCMPNALSIFYIRIANTGNSTVTLLPQTAMQMQLYGSSNNGQTKQAFIMDKSSVNPAAFTVYSTSNEYQLAAAGPNGPVPAGFAVVKFGSASEMSGSLFTFPSNGAGNFLTFIGIYYMYNGQPQGETVPFMNFDNNPTTLSPISCSQ